MKQPDLRERLQWLNQFAAFQRVKHISLFSQGQIYDTLNGDATMGEEKPEETNVTQIEKLEQALDEERKRSEENLIRLKYMQADLENLRKRFDREINEAKEHCFQLSRHFDPRRRDDSSEAEKDAKKRRSVSDRLFRQTLRSLKT
jgi:thiamine pyrophosphate-dependent acetolactate synthase large subunit-like protein